MNWKLVSKPTAAIQEYQLIDNDSCKLILKYNPRHQSARISCGSHQRLFYIEKAGQLTAKTLFKDQYGMETGHQESDKWSENIGSVTIDDKRYNYQLRSSNEFIIYTTNPNDPLASCVLNNSPSTINNILNSSLLLSMCWYLFLPVVAKESFNAFA